MTIKATATEAKTYGPGNAHHHGDEAFWVFEGTWIKAQLTEDRGWGRSINLETAEPSNSPFTAAVGRFIGREMDDVFDDWDNDVDMPTA